MFFSAQMSFLNVFHHPIKSGQILFMQPKIKNLNFTQGALSLDPRFEGKTLSQRKNGLPQDGHTCIRCCLYRAEQKKKKNQSNMYI